MAATSEEGVVIAIVRASSNGVAASRSVNVVVVVVIVARSVVKMRRSRRRAGVSAVQVQMIARIGGLTSVLRGETDWTQLPHLADMHKRLRVIGYVRPGR